MPTERPEDLVTLTRLSTKPNAVRAILDWTERRTGATAVLLGDDGSVLATSPARPDAPTMAAAVGAVHDIRQRGPGSAVVDSTSGTITLVSLGAREHEDRTPYLVTIGCADRQHSHLLVNTARVLGLCWRIQEAEEHRQRVNMAETLSREAVLHLLMMGNVSAAQRVATTLRAPLPEVYRVHIIECAGQWRSQITAQVQEHAKGKAWMLPCPVRPHHLIALVPPVATNLDEAITERVPIVRVGVSGEASLRDAATAYQQAFHALAVARSVPTRSSRFNRHADLAPLMGPAGHAWARQFLAPCLRYTPARRTDPGSEELLSTLESWLTFESGATRHLRIHRNTLAARLRLLNELFDFDLARIRDQSIVWLALRLHTHVPTPEGPTRPLTLDDLLAPEIVTAWARNHVRPLEEASFPQANETVRVWLGNDAQLPATAKTLGISLPGARKRLAKAEQILDRSLLHAPSAKHELWLAMHVLDAV